MIEKHLAYNQAILIIPQKYGIIRNLVRESTATFFLRFPGNILLKTIKITCMITSSSSSSSMAWKNCIFIYETYCSWAFFELMLHLVRSIAACFHLRILKNRSQLHHPIVFCVYLSANILPMESLCLSFSSGFWRHIVSEHGQPLLNEKVLYLRKMVVICTIHIIHDYVSFIILLYLCVY